jgi:multidrug resistance efflux pump
MKCVLNFKQEAGFKPTQNGTINVPAGKTGSAEEKSSSNLVIEEQKSKNQELQDALRRIEKLEKENVASIAKIQELETDLRGVRGENRDLTTENKKLSGEIHNSKQVNQKEKQFENDNLRLKEELKNLRSENV